MPEYTVELIVAVEAASREDAEKVAYRAAELARTSGPVVGVKRLPRNARVTNVVVADVRSGDE